MASEASIPSVPILACSSCGLEQGVPASTTGVVASCARCDGTLERRAGTSLDAGLALAATAFLLLLPANYLVLMHIRLAGTPNDDWIISSSIGLWQEEYRSLGLLVGVLAVAMPPIWLGGLTLVLGLVRLGLNPPWLGRLFHLLLELRTWAMADVFLVGSIVAYTRLQDYAEVSIGMGGWAFVAAAVLALSVDACIDRRSIWTAIGSETSGEPAPTDFACLGCQRRSAESEEGHPCPRCGATLHRRKPHSVERATALVVAGYLLYVPANVLPIMTIVKYGRPDPNTIISGIRELFVLGLWPLALIVFTASLAIPLLKLAGMTWMLVALHRGSAAKLVLRTKLYRVIELIGRWSNIDVFMISILAGIVQFGRFANVQAEPGAIAFAAVVVLTMIASHAFDPRLMWDAAGVDE